MGTNQAEENFMPATYEKISYFTVIFRCGVGSLVLFKINKTFNCISFNEKVFAR